jgi:tripartite-type tricarboxylate transporter receptor subunit TctC
VPYKGGGPGVVSIVSGETSATFATIPSSLPHLQAGRLIGLGVSSSQRNKALPDVPTIAEAGVTGYEAYEWQGLMAPAGTPTAVVRRVQQEFAKALVLPDMRERLASLGADAVGSSPDDLGRFIRREFTSWGKVVKEAGIKIE